MANLAFLIKVVTRYKNFQFDFYAAPVCLVENSKKIHEVWVWVRDDARRFEIQHKDLGVYRGRLPERLQPYKVYEMVLTTDKIITTVQESLPGFITVTSNPTGAKVLIDGKNTGLKTPAQKSIKMGAHIITLQHDLYENETANFNIQQGQTKNVSITFSKPLFGILELETTEGADIFYRP